MPEKTRCILILVIAMAVLAGCGDKESEPAQKGQTETDSLTIIINGIDGMSIFEITSATHQIDYVESSMGVFVKGIDSIYSDRQYAWFISVNDSMIATSADKYITRDSDIVKWHYRKLD